MCVNSVLIVCYLTQFPCDVTNYSKSSDIHRDVRYTDSSVAWVLIAAIIVFFMVTNVIS